jgi:hypothetical protein
MTSPDAESAIPRFILQRSAPLLIATFKTRVDLPLVPHVPVATEIEKDEFHVRHGRFALSIQDDTNLFPSVPGEALTIRKGSPEVFA